MSRMSGDVDPNIAAIVSQTRKTVEKLHGPKPSRRPDPDEFGLDGSGLDDYDEFGEDDERQVAEEMGITPTPKEERRRPRATVRAPGAKRRSNGAASMAERAAKLRGRRKLRFDYDGESLRVMESGRSVLMLSAEELDKLLAALGG